MHSLDTFPFAAVSSTKQQRGTTACFLYFSSTGLSLSAHC